ncbi:hypothetical protein AB0904_27800 [Streptomyces sp. NPDC006684]|uniref:hypothetical protein n=1 Tax=Streptomyces sp. NPDC006684 TaxID=3154477 RepID=UPI0034531519
MSARPTLIRRTPAQLRAQRAVLLAEAGATYEHLAERAAVWALAPAELDVWRTVEDIDWLLGED